MNMKTVEQLRQRALLSRELAELKTLGIAIRQQIRICAMQDEAVAGAIEHIKLEQS